MQVNGVETQIQKRSSSDGIVTSSLKIKFWGSDRFSVTDTGRLLMLKTIEISEVSEQEDGHLLDHSWSFIL